MEVLVEGGGQLNALCLVGLAQTPLEVDARLQVFLNALLEKDCPREAADRFAGLVKALAGIKVGMGADGIKHSRQQWVTGPKPKARLHHQSVGVRQP